MFITVSFMGVTCDIFLQVSDCCYCEFLNLSFFCYFWSIALYLCEEGY